VLQRKTVTTFAQIVFNNITPLVLLQQSWSCGWFW